MPLLRQISVPGFATGGSFTVGGSGGADSQLVAFKATPGEHVDVSHGGGSSAAVDKLVAVVQELLNQPAVISVDGYKLATVTRTYLLRQAASLTTLGLP